MTQTVAIPAIELEELLAALHNRRVAEFWNVLTDDYFGGEIIPGSRRVPLDQIGREVVHTGLPKDTAIVTYCSGPDCPQSRAAAEKLAALGYQNVRPFEGGLAAWKAAGRQTKAV